MERVLFAASLAGVLGNAALADPVSDFAVAQLRDARPHLKGEMTKKRQAQLLDAVSVGAQSNRNWPQWPRYGGGQIQGYWSAQMAAAIPEGDFAAMKVGEHRVYGAAPGRYLTTLKNGAEILKGAQSANRWAAQEQNMWLRAVKEPLKGLTLHVWKFSYGLEFALMAEHEGGGQRLYPGYNIYLPPYLRNGVEFDGLVRPRKTIEAGNELIPVRHEAERFARAVKAMKTGIAPQTIAQLGALGREFEAALYGTLTGPLWPRDDDPRWTSQQFRNLDWNLAYPDGLPKGTTVSILPTDHYLLLGEPGSWPSLTLPTDWDTSVESNTDYGIVLKQKFVPVMARENWVIIRIPNREPIEYLVWGFRVQDGEYRTWQQLPYPWQSTIEYALSRPNKEMPRMDDVWGAGLEDRLRAKAQDLRQGTSS